MLHSVAALKLKGNSYFLSSFQTHVLLMNSICSQKNLDERLSRTTFVSHTTYVPFTAFNLNEHDSSKYFHKLFLCPTAFQKCVTISTWIFNHLLLNKRGYAAIVQVTLQ